MSVKYFKNNIGKIFGFDGDQQDLIDKAIESGWVDITESWPPKPDFKDQQSAALVRVENYHAQQVQALVGNPTQVEKDTWAMKLETANSIISQTTLSDAGHAFLISAGLKSDDDQKNWAQSVVAKSVRYSTYVGVAERLRDTARAAVRAAENEEALKIVMDEQQAIAEQTIEALKQG